MLSFLGKFCGNSGNFLESALKFLESPQEFPHSALFLGTSVDLVTFTLSVFFLSGLQ